MVLYHALYFQLFSILVFKQMIIVGYFDYDSFASIRFGILATGPIGANGDASNGAQTSSLFALMAITIAVPMVINIGHLWIHLKGTNSVIQ